MSNFGIILLFLLHPVSFVQGSNKSHEQSTIISIHQTRNDTFAKPDLFSSGFIDIVNSGQVNASARFIRLLIGEGKFQIPVSIYSGVSSNSFSNQQVRSYSSNTHLINSFINPSSGLLNMVGEGKFLFNPNKPVATNSIIFYQAGVRILTGYKIATFPDPLAGSPINFLNSFITAGLHVQTIAREQNNTGRTGICWLAVRYILSKTNPKQLTSIVPNPSNAFYHGWSFAFGIEINELLNARVVYYHYTRLPGFDSELPIYQFSFNYSMK